ncbi:MAG: peroxiredoxin [Haloarculaceae archaeon]
MTLQEGDPAPQVSARNQYGETVEPDFSKPTVVYFYPKDDTPGCTVEAEQFDAELETYHDAGVQVFGVSADDVDSHADFAEKYDIEFDLLADTEGELVDAFGVGTRSGGLPERTTFVIDDGEVRATYTGVDPDGHAREVMMDMLDAGLAEL